MDSQQPAQNNLERSDTATQVNDRKVVKGPAKVFWLLLGVLIGFVVGVAVTAGAIALVSSLAVKSINSYEECVAAGYPIQESYPEKCAVPGGKTFTRQISSTPIQPGQGNDNEGIAPGEPAPGSGAAGGIELSLNETENPEYYGSSTKGSCSQNSECKISGCNSEICGAVSEGEMISICIAPEKQTPAKAGYGCTCSDSQCKWTK